MWTIHLKELQLLVSNLFSHLQVLVHMCVHTVRGWTVLDTFIFTWSSVSESFMQTTSQHNSAECSTNPGCFYDGILSGERV